VGTSACRRIAEIVGTLPEGAAQLKIINWAGHSTWKDAPDRYWPIITEFITRMTGRELADTYPTQSIREHCRLVAGSGLITDNSLSARCTE
jgi:hypothetical protein